MALQGNEHTYGSQYLTSRMMTGEVPCSCVVGVPDAATNSVSLRYVSDRHTVRSEPHYKSIELTLPARVRKEGKFWWSPYCVCRFNRCFSKVGSGNPALSPGGEYASVHEVSHGI